ncbi:MAG: LysM peptidoglycan-binding domain-containing protein [Chloroflexi bacterium]|nr:LysM peptidoglycan-binding domain-containing protein [Chloroflexota bacterium]
MKQRNLMFTIVIAVCIAAVGIGLAIAASFGILNVASAPAAIAPTAVPTIATPTIAAPATAIPTTAIPATAIPATAVPATSAPATAVPTTTVPATTVPTTAAPATAVPTITVPATAIPATSAPESQGQYIEYTVQRGDTLFAIARLYNVTAEDILAVNTIANPASLTIGQVLRIPTGTATTQIVEYTVQPGDILVVIARRFDVTVEEILAINTIRDPSNLTVGQVLRIPRRTP